NWKEDASRRDFTINSIYADIGGNLFDPFNGKKDLENGKVDFIGNAETRIKEDYLRVLRYIRFFLNYSKTKHNQKTIKAIKKNLGGFSKISSERLLDEFKKLLKSQGFFKLTRDKDCLEIMRLIFPQFKNFAIFNKLNSFAKKNFTKVDFIFLVSLMIIDGSDNVDYFLYKFNISKKDQKRLLFLNNFNSQKMTNKTFSEENLNKIFYYNGKEALIDIINFKIFRSNRLDNNLIKIIENFKDKKIPIMPIKANILIEKYSIPEGKELGNKLKMIEEFWVNNGFRISEVEVLRIVKS
ncbi:CCA tRNA nucleotidyltransferase, partial [Candidatus Pelagibacter sp.]|nr:CCA tRNA nucleotidyltransferase [Candidatus Pelagibacter sp.]